MDFAPIGAIILLIQDPPFLNKLMEWQWVRKSFTAKKN